jgi:hypothetical protein
MANGGTDYLYAVKYTMNQFEKSCPANSSRYIVLITDGIPTFSYSKNVPVDLESRRRITAPSTFLDARFLNEYLKDPDLTLTKELSNSGARLITVLEGKNARPNYLKIPRTDGLPGFFTPLELMDMGYEATPFLPEMVRSGSLGVGWSGAARGLWTAEGVPPILANDPVCDHEKPAFGADFCAWKYHGLPGITFQNPNAAMLRLALLSKGLYCPILENLPDECYDSKGEWIAGGTGPCKLKEWHSPTKKNNAGQIFDCIQAMLRTNTALVGSL